MATSSLGSLTVGWIGTGRMGFPMAARLLKAGAPVSVYNRTRAKAEPLAELGAKIVNSPADLAGCDIVFTMVAGPEDLKQVAIGEGGVLRSTKGVPKILIDCSTVSEEASAAVRAVATEKGASMLAAPVSGNGKVVKAGKLSIVASGPKAAYDRALPYLAALGIGVSYVGDGDVARMVKICHNVFLGVVAASLAEVTILAEKNGVSRHAFLDFMNKSVMGSMFTRYKSPAFVNLDFTPAFTSVLLRKDLDLGLSAGHALNVPLPIASMVREILQSLIGNGYAETDFAAMIALQAKNAGMTIQPENVKVNDGLEG